MSDQPQQPSFREWAATRLENADEPQIREDLCDGHGGYCAVGVLLHALKYSDDMLVRMHKRFFTEQQNNIIVGTNVYHHCLRAAFLEKRPTWKDDPTLSLWILINLTITNDKLGYTFAEIAAELRKLV